MEQSTNKVQSESISKNGHHAESVPALLPNHRQMLVDRAISAEVIEQQCYSSVTDSLGLMKDHGLPAAPTPGMIIPIHPPGGGCPKPIYRPDRPAGKRKYLLAPNERVRLDSPLRCHADLKNAAVPLVIVEGPLKAAAAASQGYCAVALMGVDAFGGKPEPGLPISYDWEVPALAGREVWIPFDSDCWSNPNVFRALRRLTRFLRERGARVRWIRLPDAEDGSKQGLDDWFAAGHSREELEALIEEPAVDPLIGAPLDDAGNAERFASEKGHLVRWNVDHQRWVCWDGKRLADSNPEAVIPHAVTVTRKTQILVSDLPISYTNRDKLVKHAANMGNHRGLEAMTKLARSPLAIRALELDADPWLFNCENGTIDLRTGALRDHDPEDHISLISPVAFNPEAEAPEFERFLADILNHDQELIDFIGRNIGYSMTGLTNEQSYTVLTGKGGNGKGVLLRILTKIMGDYALNLPAAALHRGRSSAQGFDIADLPGKRLVTSFETTTTNHLDEQRIKALTGQEAYTAEHKYGRPFTFTPASKIWLAVNGLPPTDDASEGFWRRPAVIHFPNSYSPETDPGLWDRLEAELPGILAWMVRGCLEWQKRPLRPFPESVKAAVSNWRSEQDSLLAFFTECCEDLGNMNASVPKGHLLNVYREWSRNSGEPEIKTVGRGAEWAKELKAHGLKGSSENGAAVWKGVRLNGAWAEWAEGSSREASQFSLRDRD